MYAATHKHIGDADIFVAAAAVSDYRPADTQAQKIKKNDTTMTIDLVRSEDILASSRRAGGRPVYRGLRRRNGETQRACAGKLQRKKLDMIVANQVGGGKGFDSDQNAATVFWKAAEQTFESGGQNGACA